MSQFLNTIEVYKAIPLELELQEYVNFLDFLKSNVQSEAWSKKEDAEYGGRHDDGGASRMVGELEIYFMGLNKQIPEHWVKYLDSFKFKENLKKDPDGDFALYLKLREKFKDVESGGRPEKLPLSSDGISRHPCQ